LHHFLSKFSWLAQELRQQRLEIILKILSGREIILIIDDRGDKKQGGATDYVKRQYIGNLGKTENGIVAVTAYAYIDGITLPLRLEVYKPIRFS
jgi:SRSO17 transposase